MSDLNEKKWFVYMGDHHEGPFSLNELQQKMQQGVITSGSYVWFEGMADWKQITEVPDCAFLLQPVVGGETASPTNVLQFSPAQDRAQDQSIGEPALAEPVAVVASPQSEPQGQAQSVNHFAPPESVALNAQVIPAPMGDMSEKTDTDLHAPSGMVTGLKNAFFKLGKVVFFFIIIFGLIGAFAFSVSQGYLDSVIESPQIKGPLEMVSNMVYPYTSQAIQKFPALSKLFSPIRKIDDVSAEDYDELRSAAISKQLPGELQFGIAVGKNDLFFPTFYVSSNLPDSTKMEIYLEGIPDTLMNQLSFVRKAEVFIEKRLGKTAPIKFDGTKPIPRGQYYVYLVDSDPAQPILAPLQSLVFPYKGAIPTPSSVPAGRKVLAAKSYFLGGPKDGVYAERLKEFHDKLRAKASAELIELKQFVDALDSQLNGSIKKYGELKKGPKPTPKQKKAWMEFHSQWMKFSEKLEDSYKKWTALSLQNEFFYGNLYSLTQQTGQGLERVHATQHLYFTTTVSPKAFDIQLGEAVARAQTDMATLKTKLEQVEKIPPTANGMPRREGL